MVAPTDMIKRLISRTALLGAIALGVSVTLNACTSNNATTTPATVPRIASANSSATQSTTSNVVRIGYQKYGTLALLKVRGELEQQFKAQGISVQWVQFPGDLNCWKL